MFLLGGASHHRRKCPAREAMCHTCGIKGHFSSVCMKKKQGNSVGNVATTYSSSLCALGISAAFPSSLSHAAVPIVINGVALTALIDSCSSESFINEQVANRLKLTLSPTRNISMALTTLKTDIIGCCTADITLNNCTYTLKTIVLNLYPLELILALSKCSVGDSTISAILNLYLQC